MGSKNCVETPRQKMIGMMYLFLTAMLALNVASEVLEGFTLVDRSLRNSFVSFESRNSQIYTEFERQYNLNPDKAGDWKTEAEKVKARADLMVKYVQELKELIVKQADGPEGDPINIKKKDNLDASSIVMLNPPNFRGKALKDSINLYREYLLLKIDTSITRNKLLAQTVASYLKTPKPKGEGAKQWEEEIFYNMPVAACITMLTNIQNDVRNTESEVISYLLNQISATDFKVNKVQALVLPKSTYIFKGNTFSAEILLAATDSTKQPQVFADGNEIFHKKGKFLFERKADQLGKKQLKGYIIIKDNEGKNIKYNFPTVEYEVVDPVATVSATKMNVLYLGVENPISLSVPGVSLSNLKPKINNGTLTPNGTGWIAKPANLNQTAIITIDANIDNKWTQIGAGTEFRVRRLPPPRAYIVKSDGSLFEGGGISKSDILRSKGLIAKLQDSEFDVDFKVTGFGMRVYDNLGNSKNLLANDKNFTKEHQDEFRLAGSGEVYYLTGIKVVGPDNIPQTLPVIEIVIN